MESIIRLVCTLAQVYVTVHAVFGAAAIALMLLPNGPVGLGLALGMAYLIYKIAGYICLGLDRVKEKLTE